MRRSGCYQPPIGGAKNRWDEKQMRRKTVGRRTVGRRTRRAEDVPLTLRFAAPVLSRSVDAILPRAPAQHQRVSSDRPPTAATCTERLKTRAGTLKEETEPAPRRVLR